MAIAFDTYAPFDSGPGSNVTEDGWRAMQRRMSVSGVVRNVLSEMLVFGDSTGMQVKISAGEVWVEGYWGQLASTKTAGIVTAHATLTRYDLVIAVVDWTNNVIQYDVLTGTPSSTPVVPPLTQNSSLWQIPLAVVTVGPAVSTITAGNVQDAREWGGAVTATTTDDWLLYGDRAGTCRRLEVTDTNVHNDGIVYYSRMHSLQTQVCSKIRMFPTTLAVGGTVAVRIFHGYRVDKLSDFVDMTTANFTYSGLAAVNLVHEGVFPATTFRAGEVIVICYRYAGGSTSPVVATTAPGAAITNIGGLITPTANPVTGFKTVAMPSSLNLTDGTWSQRNRVFWAALA
jgi:hypothetical protein